LQPSTAQTSRRQLVVYSKQKASTEGNLSRKPAPKPKSTAPCRYRSKILESGLQH
jgi:hypothetical protein